MRRAVQFVLLLALLVAVAWWLAAQEGVVEIAAGAWRIEAALPVAALLLVVAVGLLWAGFGLLRWLVRLPRRFRAWRAARRLQRGESALLQGLVAVAAGEAGSARALAGRASALLGPQPLPLLLAGMAARLAGDAPAAEAAWRTLAARPDAGFIGLRGLIVQALEAGDAPRALALTREAHAAHPDAAWPAALRFDLAVRTGGWTEALALAAEAERRGRLEPAAARRRRAVLTHAAAAAEADPAQALRLAQRAFDADPGFVPGALSLARVLGAEGRTGKAAGIIEQAWRRTPHPALAAQFLALWPEEDALRRAQRAEQLARLNATHRESHMLAAQAALAAELWGEARRHLLAALASGVRERRVFLMLAELEEHEFPGEAGQRAARDWLRRAAAEAEPDARWSCTACGHEEAAWAPLCPACGAFDSLRWTTRAAAALPPPEAPPPRPPALPGL